MVAATLEAKGVAMEEGGWAVALAGAVMVEGAMAMAADSEGTAEALVVEGLVAEGLVVKTAEGLVPARPPPPSRGGEMLRRRAWVPWLFCPRAAWSRFLRFLNAK